MQDKRKILGTYGETLTLEYLKNKGYKFVGRNIVLFCGEIDLLFQDGEAAVIVEVKTKTDESFGLPQDMINFKKKRKLLQLARALFQKMPQRTVRIDVVAVSGTKIDHIINAVEE